VFPDYPAAVVRNAGSEREIAMMRWGMPPPKFGGPPVTNIRNMTSAHWRGWLKPENRDVGRGLLSASRLRIQGIHECRCARLCDGRAVFFVHVTDPASLGDKLATIPGALLLQEHKLFRLLLRLCNAEWRKC
jgi:hypothetical protein